MLWLQDASPTKEHTPDMAATTLTRTTTTTRIEFNLNIDWTPKLPEGFRQLNAEQYLEFITDHVDLIATTHAASHTLDVERDDERPFRPTLVLRVQGSGDTIRQIVSKVHHYYPRCAPTSHVTREDS